MKKMFRAALASVLFSSLLVPARLAFAHSIAVWAEVAGNKVKVEATWSDGKPAKNSRVEVKGADGKLLLAGRTNDKGRFEFAPPAKADLTIRVVAGGHHEATASVKAEDLKNVTLPEKPSK
jgi:hypothetical protein